MSQNTRQKSVLITGCSPGGIGHGLCKEFHSRGLHVIATARNEASLAELAEAGMSTVQLDVTDAESIKTCLNTVKELTGGKLDILINNAGRTHIHPALDLNLDDVRATFEANVFGVMAMVQAFADLLISAKGLIINIASLAALSAYTFGSAYCSSKGAVISYSRTLRAEMEPLGVRVMVGMVGAVASNIHLREGRDLPPDSKYHPVADVYKRRQTFVNVNNGFTTEKFAQSLADSALSYEVPWLLRSWFGRPDWFYYGEYAKAIWWGTGLFGEWGLDWVCTRLYFNLSELAKVTAAKKDQ